jgi:hypothetical protein
VSNLCQGQPERVHGSGTLGHFLTFSTDKVDRVYCQLRDILGVATEQHSEDSLQWWADVSILSPGHLKANRQRSTIELPTASTASSPMWALSHIQSGHLSKCPEPPTHHQARRGDQGGGRGCILSTACAARATVGAMIKKGVASASKGQGPRCLGATCAARASLNIFGCLITLSNMMAKLALAFDWRTITLHAGQTWQMMTSSSSSPSPFTWLTQPGPDSITCLETRLIAGRISRRFSLTTFMTHTCGWATHGI